MGGDTIAGGIPQIVDCGCFCSPDRADGIEDGKICEVTPGDDGYEGDIVLSSGFRYEWTATGVERLEDASSPDANLGLRVKTSATELTILSPDRTEAARLKPGEWSDYFSVPFQSRVGLATMPWRQISDYFRIAVSCSPITRESSPKSIPSGACSMRSFTRPTG